MEKLKNNAILLSLKKAFGATVGFFKNHKKPILLALNIAFSVALILSTLGIVLYYIFFPGEGYFHSDCTDTIFWAQATFDSGKIISDNYSYAALLPFGGNLLMLIFMPFFGVTMLTHELGMTLFALLFVGSLIYLSRSLGYGWTLSSIMTFAVTFALSSSDKLREIMWGHVIYYSLGIMFFCFGLGMAIRLLRDREKGMPKIDGEVTEVDNPGFIMRVKRVVTGSAFKFWALFATFFIFTVCTATNGLQSIVLYILPVGAAVFLVRLTDTETKLFERRSIKYIAIFGSMIFAALVGLVLLKLFAGEVEAGYANAYSTFTGMHEWRSNFFKVFDNWFSLLGIKVYGGEPLASVESVIQMIKIFGALLLLVVPFVPFLFYKKITSRPYKLLLWANLISTGFVLFACIFGALGGVDWRLTPVVGTSAVTVVATAAEFIRHRDEFKISSRLAALCAACVCLFSSLSAVEIAKMPSDYGQDNKLHYFAELLEEEGLTYGYADFWTAQAITVISDSKVKVRNMNVEYDGDEQMTLLRRYEYQSQFTWYDDQEGVDEYFIIVTESEKRALDVGYFTIQAPKRVIAAEYNNAKYCIVVFDENPFAEIP